MSLVSSIGVYYCVYVVHCVFLIYCILPVPVHGITIPSPSPLKLCSPVWHAFWRCIELPFSDHMYLLPLRGILSYVYHCLDIGIVGSLYFVLDILVVFIQCFTLSTPLSRCVRVHACACLRTCVCVCVCVLCTAFCALYVAIVRCTPCSEYLCLNVFTACCVYGPDMVPPVGCVCALCIIVGRYLLAIFDAPLLF